MAPSLLGVLRLLAASLQNALVDEVGLGAVAQGGENVVHLLRGTEAVVVDPLALAARTFTGTAAPRLLVGQFDFGMKFHGFVGF